MTDAEADEWLAGLFKSIKRDHPHLDRRWWEPMTSSFSKYRSR